MTTRVEAIKSLRKASKLVRLSFRENGPRSFKRGTGALLSVLNESETAVFRDELTVALGATRVALKDIVRKAQRAGYVSMITDAEGNGYTVELTDLGKEVAAKRAAAMDKAAENALSCLTDEEVEQFAALNEKISLALHEQGISAKKKGTKRSQRRKPIIEAKEQVDGNRATDLFCFFCDRMPSFQPCTPFASLFWKSKYLCVKLLDRTNSFYILIPRKNYWIEPIVLNR